MSIQLADTLERTKIASPDTVARLRSKEERIAAVRAERYRPDRESAEIARVNEEYAAAESNAVVTQLRQIDSEHARAKAELEATIKRETGLPERQSGELDTAFSTRVALAAVAETKRAQAASLALADLQLIAATEDVERISAIAAGAVDLPWESRSRVLAAAEARLFTLATRQNRRGQKDPKAEGAWTRLRMELDSLNKQHAAQSPQARRTALDNAYGQRKVALTSSALQIGAHTGVEAILRSAIAAAEREKR